MALEIACNENLTEIVKFKQKWGDCDVTQKYAKNPNIVGLVRNQRFE